jgi:toxin ParE1/3/4
LAPVIRRFPFGRHVIFCVPLDERIDVVRVLHAARDVDAQFDKPSE